MYSILILLFSLLLNGCSLSRIDTMSPFLRSDIVSTTDDEQKILSKAKIGWDNSKNIRVIYLSGSPYEIGYQHGALLRSEVQDNLQYLYHSAIRKFKMPELFDEAFERMRPHIPENYLQEMHGLAHGAKLPLKMVHAVHMLPEIAEWGGKRKIKEVIKSMITGDFQTSCSNIGALPSTTLNKKMYSVRVLDWGLHRISKAHEYPTIMVVKPNQGIPFANITWSGFLGTVSGMNAAGITIGEMGYGNPPSEQLRGIPMTFLLRDVLLKAQNLDNVRYILGNAKGTNSFVFLMSDGKSKEASMFIKDALRFKEFKPNTEIKDGNTLLPPILGFVYGGHFQDKMFEQLNKFNGKITPEILIKEIIPNIAMDSNFQNVIYDPENLVFWVANAANSDEPADEQPYRFFDLKKALQEFN
jgi:isopenicillin-N N-acyltransferase like protein